ncbi:MAG TPA: ABC transporter ATP-binding protein [Thermodesulfobacteriota bacterium]|nr:ABC transporter ATP-binding protein [Thermodesulfobacteriota bacterium]
MLVLEKVTCGYVEGIDILLNVSLEIKEDIITGMIGPNGAGKSTILKTIFALLHPREGRILFEGREIQDSLPHQLKWMGMSYVTQGFSTFPQLTVEDNLRIGAWVFRKDKKLLDQRLNEVYEFFPVLRERRRAKANVLSGGLLRMLSLGKELITRPKLLLLDEPSEGVAPLIVNEIYLLMQKIKKQGTTIFLVDQNILKALEVSNYMYLLEMGQIKQKGPKEEFEDKIREIIRDSLMSR